MLTNEEKLSILYPMCSWEKRTNHCTEKELFMRTKYDRIVDMLDRGED